MTILNLSESKIINVREIPELVQREWRYKTEPNWPKPEKRGPVKVEFRKVLYTIPLLWLSGIFTGVAIMIALT